MKTSYKILWIDDEPGNIRVDRENVENYLEEFGIRADISTVTKLVDQSISGMVSNPELDILLVDYHMEGMDGAKLVGEIRNTHHVYLPVIFYSALGLEVISRAAYEAKLDGVYLAHRDFVIEKFKDVANSLLNKEHTPKRTRGLLIEEVSEIDVRFKEIYGHAWEALSEKGRNELREHLKVIIDNRMQTATDKSESFPTDLEEFSRHMDDKFLSKSYDTYTRWRVVLKMLGYLGSDLGECIEILKEFGSRREGDSLIQLRNTYAHIPRRELKSGHSMEKCVKIRQEIHRQQDNINRIVATVTHHN